MIFVFLFMKVTVKGVFTYEHPTSNILLSFYVHSYVNLEMLDVGCLDVGCLDVGSTSNIQHPFYVHSYSNFGDVGCWMMDVGCWMFICEHSLNWLL